MLEKIISFFKFMLEKIISFLCFMLEAFLILFLNFWIFGGGFWLPMLVAHLFFLGCLIGGGLLVFSSI